MQAELSSNSHPLDISKSLNGCVAKLRTDSLKLAENCDRILKEEFQRAFSPELQTELGLVLIAAGSYARRQQLPLSSDADTQLYCLKIDPNELAENPESPLAVQYRASIEKFLSDVNLRFAEIGVPAGEAIQTRSQLDLEHQLQDFLALGTISNPKSNKVFRYFVESFCNTLYSRQIAGDAEFSPASIISGLLQNKELERVLEKKSGIKDLTLKEFVTKSLISNLHLCFGEHRTLSSSTLNLKENLQRSALLGMAIIDTYCIAEQISPALKAELETIKTFLSEVIDAGNLFRQASKKLFAQHKSLASKFKANTIAPELLDAYAEAFAEIFPALGARVNPMKLIFTLAEKTEFHLRRVLKFAADAENYDLVKSGQIDTESPFSAWGNVASRLHARLILDSDFLPQFDLISGLIDPHPYQVYSLSEHSIRAIEILDRIARNAEEDIRFFQIFNSLNESEKLCLYVATLLHDVGKKAEIDQRIEDPYYHAEVGAALAISACENLGLSIEQQRLVAQLIKNHLWLKDVSKNAIYHIHESLLAGLPEELKNEEFIKLLVLLTYADGKSTNPESWTIFRSNALHEAGNSAVLNIRGSNYLTDQNLFLDKLFADYWPRIKPEQREMAQQMIDSLPKSFRALPRESISDFINMYQAYQGEPLVIIIQHNLSNDTADSLFKADILILCEDRPYLASNLVSCLSGYGIQSADFFCNDQGIAFNRATVFSGSSRVDELSSLQKEINKRLSRENLEVPENKRISKLNPDVTEISLIPSAHDDTHFTIKIKTVDQYSLLQRILIAFNNSGLNLQSSCVNTEGKNVENFFELARGTRAAPISLSRKDLSEILRAIKSDLLPIEVED